MTTLGYALLGLLAREPLSGYDLAGLMRARVGFFWEARHSQIYPELARLEGKGLVTHVVVEQQDRPDKKVYEITAAGLSALKEWVTTPVEQRAARDELVLKAYSMWLADPGRAVALFREPDARRVDPVGLEAVLERREPRPAQERQRDDDHCGDRKSAADKQPEAHTGIVVTVRLAFGQGGAARGNPVAVLLAQAARRILRQRVAVALSVGSAHERRDDLDVPLVDLGGLPPEVGQAEVDVELEQVDAAWALGHEKERRNAVGRHPAPTR